MYRVAECDAEKPPEKSSSWFNWWPAPVITSGAMLAGFSLVALMMIVLGAGLLLILGLGSHFLGAPSLGGATLIGWGAYRLLRQVL